MKFLALCALFAVASSKQLRCGSDLDHHWENFKSAFVKKYDGKEESVRRLIWEKNVGRVVRHNLEADMKQHPFTMGVNEYSDLEKREFIEMFNGALIPDFPDNSTYNGSTWTPPSKVDLPDRVDWREHGLVTGIKDQRQCGSCYVFSATGSLEGQHKKKTGNLVSLSEQNGVDCSKYLGNLGCGGGYVNKVFEYVMKNGGVDTESSYPYEARDDRPCRFNQATVGATCSGYVSLPQGNEEHLKWAVATVGPVSVLIDSDHDSFIHYRGGVYYEPACSSTHISHAVLVVGYGTESGMDYWLVKNSWGTSWGMGGYIKMARNRNNNCLIATYASYPLV